MEHSRTQQKPTSGESFRCLQCSLAAFGMLNGMELAA